MKFASCIVLALFSLADGKANDVTGCIMSNTGAVNNLVNSALFIYVTDRNCKNFEDDTKVCVKDLASVVNSVSGVAEFMIKAFKTCGEIKTSNYDCAIAGTHLSGVLTGLTANTAAATMDCPVVPAKIGGNKKWSYAGASLCNVFIGGATGALQGAVTSMMAVKAKCGKKHGSGDLCVSGVLDIISAVGNLAVFLENVVTDCSQDDMRVINPCSTDVGAILSGLAATASTSITIKDKCTPKSTPNHYVKYEETDAPLNPTHNGANLLTGMLVVFLPITGFASYYGGSRLKDRQARRTRILVAGDEECLQ